MNKERIEKAVEIINYAIDNGVSVKHASVICGRSNTYVKNVKADLMFRHLSGNLDKNLFELFQNAYKRYADSNDETTQKIIEENKPADIPSSNGQTLIYQEDGNNADIEWKSGSNYSSDHIKTLDELLDATKVDKNVWNVKNYVVNKWDVTSWKKGLPETVQNFQVKAWLEKNTKTVKERAVGEIFREMTQDYEPPVFTPKIDYLPLNNGENNLLEITLFDLHIGKLAWGGETGENYDTKIARSRFLLAIEKLIQRASGFQFSRIVFPVGSDFFNSDTIYNTTTKGTPQDEDLRWQKTFQVGVRLLVDAINILKSLGVPIDVIVIPGNHDFERSYYMGEYLCAWYNNDPQVAVNNGASPRKYYRFGKVLIGYTHGSEEKEGNLPMIMANDIESKPMWSETVFHEWHLGHIHRKRNVKHAIVDKNMMVNEDLGVTVRYLSSLTGTEEWHHKKGFIGSLKAGEAFIWNDETGLIAHLNANISIEE
jgi:hypothetical protein